MAFPIVVDVSSYQYDTLSYFKALKSYGASGAMVKLTESISYVNPKAGNQIKNAYSVFGRVGVYHYFHGYGTAEAKYFLSKIKAYGLDKSTVLAIDVEDPSLSRRNNSAQINAFFRYLINAGYNNLVTYASSSWFKGGQIVRSSLIKKAIWVASYGTSQPGVANANAWQFSSSWHGIDASYDFDGTLLGTGSASVPAKASYYVTPGLYEVKCNMLHVYNDTKFKSKRYTRYKKGSRFWATPIKYGKITRLKINGQGYASSNKDLVAFKKATKKKAS